VHAMGTARPVPRRSPRRRLRLWPWSDREREREREREKGAHARASHDVCVLTTVAGAGTEADQAVAALVATTSAVRARPLGAPADRTLRAAIVLPSPQDEDPSSPPPLPPRLPPTLAHRTACPNPLPGPPPPPPDREGGGPVRSLPVLPAHADLVAAQDSLFDAMLFREVRRVRVCVYVASSVATAAADSVVYVCGGVGGNRWRRRRRRRRQTRGQ
jgi:hypothetical protein